MSRFCSQSYESTELALDVCQQFSRVFLVFTTSGLRCSPLDLRFPMVKLLVLGPSCCRTDSRSTTVKLALPCVSKVFWLEGSTFLGYCCCNCVLYLRIQTRFDLIEFSRHLIRNLFTNHSSCFAIISTICIQ